MAAPKLKPIQSADRVVRNLFKDADAYQDFDPAVYPGQSVLQLDERRALGTGFHVFRMAPGTTTTPHEHTSDEWFYLLEGDLVDNDGTPYEVGDLVLLRAGTQHCSTSEKGCTLLVYIDTFEENLG